MRRWHAETRLMFRRWKIEMGKHGYDWRDPPTDPDACHCAQGIGSMRKKRPYDCGNVRCGICHYSKYGTPKDRYNRRRRAIESEIYADAE